MKSKISTKEPKNRQNLNYERGLMYKITANLIDLHKKAIYPAIVEIEGEKIVSITPTKEPCRQYILPGFIDAHIHIESSMLIPSEFARLATPHGTVATVSDPHEIGNVLGLQGVRFMIENGKKVPFHFFFGAPSCVPATAFETAGATLTAKEIEELFLVDGLSYLSEMMNYPGVLQKAPEVIAKIEIAKSLGRPIDGHAPGLRGEQAKQYIAAGISTDHECYMLEEALDKLKYGMKIIIREGSAAKNYAALHTLIKSHPDKVMFCSDDKHPHELVRGHINELVRRAVVENGYDLFDVLRCACINPIMHYKLDVGMLREGDKADFIVIEDIKSFSVAQTYISGQLVAEKGKSNIGSIKSKALNKFHPRQIKENSLQVKAIGDTLKVIEAFDGELITKEHDVKVNKGALLVSDLKNDILKIVVVNRYGDAPPAIGFIKNFGLKRGAVASSIAHDSHNIIAVGVEDEQIAKSINALMDCQGGICVVDESKISVLSLPYAGLMSGEDGYLVAKEYEKIDLEAKKLGTKLQAPFMTLSFMALLVIPSLKLSDKGLFDGNKFTFVNLTS